MMKHFIMLLTKRPKVFLMLLLILFFITINIIAAISIDNKPNLTALPYIPILQRDQSAMSKDLNVSNFQVNQDIQHHMEINHSY